MMKSNGYCVGTYGVRTVGEKYKEKVMHAPKNTDGRFDLWVYPDGTLEYRPTNKKVD